MTQTTWWCDVNRGLVVKRAALAALVFVSAAGATGCVARESKKDKIAVVYAPTPKNAECPIEICPVNPIRRFSDSAARARMQMSVSSPYWFGRRSPKIGRMSM